MRLTILVHLLCIYDTYCMSVLVNGSLPFCSFSVKRVFFLSKLSLRIEADVYYTDFKALLCKFLILGYRSKILVMRIIFLSVWVLWFSHHYVQLPTTVVEKLFRPFTEVKVTRPHCRNTQLCRKVIAFCTWCIKNNSVQCKKLPVSVILFHIMLLDHYCWCTDY